MNSTSTIEILSIPKYQEYDNYQKAKYPLVYLVFNAEKYYTGTYYTCLLYTSDAADE